MRIGGTGAALAGVGGWATLAPAIAATDGGAAPAARNTDLAALLEPDDAVAWHAPDKTAALLALMAPQHLARIEAARRSETRQVGAVFRRMRVEDGQRVQRAEVRFDGLAGCLRTPRGGSSRQTLVVVEHGQVRSRLVSPREGARLMGLPDGYALPPAATGALHVVGDGVVVPVVRAACWAGRRAGAGRCRSITRSN